MPSPIGRLKVELLSLCLPLALQIIVDRTSRALGVLYISALGKIHVKPFLRT